MNFPSGTNIKGGYGADENSSPEKLANNAPATPAIISKFRRLLEKKEILNIVKYSVYVGVRLLFSYIRATKYYFRTLRMTIKNFGIELDSKMNLFFL